MTQLFTVDGDAFGFDEWDVLCYDCASWLVDGTSIDVITASVSEPGGGVCDDCGELCDGVDD